MALAVLPLVVVVLLGFTLAVSPSIRPLDRAITRASLAVFGTLVERRRRSAHADRRVLAGAHVGRTYRTYAARAMLFGTAAGAIGAVLGAYGAVGLEGVLASRDLAVATPGSLARVVETLGDVMPSGTIPIALAGGVSAGSLLGFATYRAFFVWPRYVAGERERRIDASLKRNVAFMYALSRSGMPYPEVLAILAKNRGVYGETAREIEVAVKDVDYFGADVLTAIGRLRDRTPSRTLEEFAENLTSVLQSGRSLSTFLRDQYEYLEEEEAAQQQAFLERLSTLAEAYVTVFVAGPLFLITILVVMGLMLGDTLTFLRVMVYFVLPLATVGFVIYLDSITEDGRASDHDRDASSVRDRFPDVRTIPSERAATDGGGSGLAANRYRLHLHERIGPLLSTLRRPIQALTRRPRAILALSIPLGILWVGVHWWPHLVARTTEIAVYDDALIQATLFVTGTFAVVYEEARRRERAIEEAVPDFLDRMASTNEAGMSIVESFGRVVQSDLGALTPELERTWADVVWGARVEDALERFRRRVGTPAVTRVVTLTRNATAATNDVGQVLRIAADEAQATRRLERERRNEMLTYTVVVYISFLVFLVIIVALEAIFVPAIPTVEAGAAGTVGGVPTGGIGAGLRRLTPATKAAYSLVFFHAALVQSVASGFVAGQMGAGDLEAGAKHATVMLAVAYVLFVLIA